MPKIETTTSDATATDVTTIAPLVDEVHAAEVAWRDGELPPLTATDRLALRAARRLLLWSRHHREHASAARTPDHTFEHRVEAGLPR